MKTDIFNLQTILLIVIIVLLLIQLAIKLTEIFKKGKQKNKDGIASSEKEISKNNIEYIKTKFETQLKDIQQKLQAVDNKLSENKPETKPNANSTQQLIDKVKNVDFLKDYAENVYKYLETLENIIKTANRKYKELRQHEKTANAIGCLLQNTCINMLDFGEWLKLAEEIKIYGIVIDNQDIKNCFQSNNNNERLKQFKILFSTPLKKYTNNLLILCEALRNLSKFNDNEIAVENLEKEFETQFNNIIKESKNVGIVEIYAVKLFTNLNVHKNTKSINGDISLPYLNVKNLNNEDIIEIVEFGMKTEFENKNSVTKVLIQ